MAYAVEDAPEEDVDVKIALEPEKEIIGYAKYNTWNNEALEFLPNEVQEIVSF